MRISMETYRELLEASVRLELLSNIAKNADYISTDELRALLGVKREEKANG